MPAMAFSLLAWALIRVPGQSPALAHALGDNRKGYVSGLLYALSIPVAILFPYVSVAIFVLVSAMWFVPDRRLEPRPDSLPS